MNRARLSPAIRKHTRVSDKARSVDGSEEDLKMFLLLLLFIVITSLVFYPKNTYVSKKIGSFVHIHI